MELTDVTVRYFWPGWQQPAQEAEAEPAPDTPAEAALALVDDNAKLEAGRVMRARASVMDAWAELEARGFRLARVVA